MKAEKLPKIVVKTLVQAPLERVWKLWTSPEHITQWNHASDEWHTPKATNDLRVGGEFHYQMEAKDGSMGFDFGGVYEEIVPNKRIVFTLEDERKVAITFAEKGDITTILETFEAETENAIEMQRNGWQAILTNFQQYAESSLS